MTLQEILNNYKDANGNELSLEIKDRIVKMYEEPTSENWKKAHLIIMRKHVTSLWDLVCKVDGTYPKEYPKETIDFKPPDIMTLLRALKL